MNELRDKTVHGPVGLQSDEIGNDLDHIPGPSKRNIGELGKALVEYLLGSTDKLLVPGDISWLKLFDLRDHSRGIATIIEAAPVGKEDAVERIDGHELDVIFDASSCPLEELVDQEGGCDDRWPTVKLEAVLLVDVGAAPRLVALLENGDLMALVLQANSRRQSAETGSDDNDPHVSPLPQPKGEVRVTRCMIRAGSPTGSFFHVWWSRGSSRGHGDSV